MARSSSEITLRPEPKAPGLTLPVWLEPTRFLAQELGFLLTLLKLIYRSLTSILWEGRRGRKLVRRIILQQVYFTAVQSTTLTALVAVAIGTLLMHQASVILPRYGLPDFAEWLTVLILFREIAPLTVALVIIARSANAIVIELGNMRVNGEIRALEVLGINLDRFLVLPRIVGMTISVTLLTVIFCAAAMWGGYWTAQAAGLLESSFLLESLLENFTLDVFLNILLRAFTFGIVIASVSCVHGLWVRSASTEVPQQASRGVVHSLSLCFILNFVISLVFFTGTDT